jgi:hypothetical protein
VMVTPPSSATPFLPVLPVCRCNRLSIHCVWPWRPHFDLSDGRMN